MKPGTRFVHAVYLVTAVTGVLLAALALFYGAAILYWPFFALIPGARATWRRIRSGAVIPAGLVSERPIVASIVTLAGLLGLFFKAIFATAAIDIALAPEWPDEAGKIAIFAMAAVFFDVISLMCGEMALVGKGESDAARAARSPFS